MNIALSIQNDSSATAPTLVLFCCSGATSAPAIAWKVIRNCPSGWRHPFVFSSTAELDISDAHGNHVTPLAARHGMVFALLPEWRGRRLIRCRSSCASDRIVVRNDMKSGAVHANLYRNKRLFSRIRLAPGSVGQLACVPTLWVGIAEAVSEGGAFLPQQLCPDAKAFCLQGLGSAVLVLREQPDGSGNYQIALERQVPA
ncbi:MAG TPA: hypothetical protein VGC21_03595 [Telluria sp.]|jgi:hypothetical protein